MLISFSNCWSSPGWFAFAFRRAFSWLPSLLLVRWWVWRCGVVVYFIGIVRMRSLFWVLAANTSPYFSIQLLNNFDCIPASVTCSSATELCLILWDFEGSQRRGFVGWAGQACCDDSDEVAAGSARRELIACDCLGNVLSRSVFSGPRYSAA